MDQYDRFWASTIDNHFNIADLHVANSLSLSMDR
jgi:hypothetical protein